MSFIALALTLCTAVGSDSEKCNTYFIDHFAAKDKSALMRVVDPSMGNQWGDCLGRLDEETIKARIAAKADRATKPTAKDGESTVKRAEYLKRFNIVQDVKSIDRWEYGCARINEDDTP